MLNPNQSPQARGKGNQSVTTAAVPTVEEIESLLRSVALVLKKRGRDILADFDVTPPQFEALLTLRQPGSLTMGELCQKLYLACSTATDLVDRMERNDLILRERDQADRRVIRLKITPRGKMLMEQVVQARLAYLSKVTADLSPEALVLLTNSLRDLQRRMTNEVRRPT